MEAKKIGPSFVAELNSAQLLGLPFSWSENGINFGDITHLDGTVTVNEALSPEQRAAIEAVVAAHDPTAPAPVVVPEAVTKYQACVVLARHALLSQVNAFFDALAVDDPRRLAWEIAAAVHRRSDSTLSAIAHLGLSEAQADGMFIEADQVE
ncbi:hypothetical protein [Achromobacter denitrificans]|uniref:hypothetical protein n=1 Tax=Achromobacter denitrificans TaxID=32002 RepID=UPI00243297D0|nr:hypothetical protein [Achromobacter denitrificans]MBV2160252.1 hypothetical protein [Achromobacter denitrificans]